MILRAALSVLLFASSLPAQKFDEIQAEHLVDNLKFADGIVWSRDGFLLFSDVGANKILSLIHISEPTRH